MYLEVWNKRSNYNHFEDFYLCHTHAANIDTSFVSLEFYLIARYFVLANRMKFQNAIRRLRKFSSFPKGNKNFRFQLLITTRLKKGYIENSSKTYNTKKVEFQKVTIFPKLKMKHRALDGCYLLPFDIEWMFQIYDRCLHFTVIIFRLLSIFSSQIENTWQEIIIYF